jgi:hypothetical protein
MEQNVVVQVVGLALACGDAVNIQAGQRRREVGCEQRAGLFDHFAAGRAPDLGVFGLDMPSGKQPAAETTVMDQQQALTVRS